MQGHVCIMGFSVHSFDNVLMNQETIMMCLHITQAGVQTFIISMKDQVGHLASHEVYLRTVFARSYSRSEGSGVFGVG